MSNDESIAPYGSAADSPAVSTGTSVELPESAKLPKRVRTVHLQDWKKTGHPWAMLTAYDMLTARVFDDAGIPVLLVGDSAANNVFGYDSSLPVTVDELLCVTRAVTRHTGRALIVGDLPFGSYQVSPEQGVETAIRFMKEGRCHAVKLEGGRRMAPTIRRIVDAGIPVMAHIGFTPQAEHALGGYRVQGRGEEGLAETMADALAVQEAGAFSVVLEMVPTPIATEVTKALDIPTIGIGAGEQCDAQVLVWQDMFGLRTGRLPRFVKQYGDIRQVMHDGVQQFARDVANRSFPAAEHQFLD